MNGPFEGIRASRADTLLPVVSIHIRRNATCVVFRNQPTESHAFKTLPKRATTKHSHHALTPDSKKTQEVPVAQPEEYSSTSVRVFRANCHARYGGTRVESMSSISISISLPSSVLTYPTRSRSLHHLPPTASSSKPRSLCISIPSTQTQTLMWHGGTLASWLSVERETGGGA